MTMTVEIGIAIIICMITAFGVGMYGGLSIKRLRYWEGYSRGYKQAETDLKGLPDSVPEIKG